MRIISGRFKGQKIDAVEGITARPTTDFFREMIFSVLNNLDINMINVLDLFAGSGALGFEALSRGADHIDFVEGSKKSVSTIINNLNRLDCHSQCSVNMKKAENFINHCSNKYDLILADPPYNKNFLNTIITLIRNQHILNNEGILVFEHSINEKLNDEFLPYVFKIKKGGPTQISFISFNKIYNQE
ncbi:MAG: 16S rRNA (guanine(966)-N(2))-methyltransferase RsmD [Candidatus Cloacimonetes bacterium]|nr:16S rRNA (guanine(966)-N(2))-methyltransferase RsmD [Candidatus Cloacimonadota bacterium]MDD4155445.1 16S rRNA (guanine(966)-N(2))-methyltransferase RsmD [Candidatus Cloacimonadota bacterium]